MSAMNAPGHRTLIMLVASGLLAATAQAKAATPITLGEGSLAGVALDGSGTAHVAWQGAGAHPLQYCRVPTGASACDGGVKTLVASGSDYQPSVLVVGGRIVVLHNRRDVEMLTSSDGGTTFGPVRTLGDQELLLDAVAGPGDTISYVGEFSNNLRFHNVGLDATGPTAFATLSPPNSALDFGAVDLDGATPFVLLHDSSGNAAWRRYKGSGDLNSEANWTTTSTPGYLGEEPGLSGGPLGLFATGRLSASSTRPVVRRFEGSGFGDPVVIDAQASANPTVAQDPGRRLHAVYGSSDLRHAYSDDGRAWTVERLVPSAGALRPRLAVGPDHHGVVVYGDDGIIKLARIGDPPASAPTTNPSRKTVKASGYSATLTGPSGCVPPHESFVAKVTFKRISRKAKRAKVKRVDFLIDGKRHARDTAAPFRQSLLQFDVPAGTAHTLKARVTYRIKRKTRARTITVGFRYCDA